MAVRERRETVLRVIIEDYITRAAPVASNAIVKKYAGTRRICYPPSPFGRKRTH
jgi:hypothetical protein